MQGPNNARMSEQRAAAVCDIGDEKDLIRQVFHLSTLLVYVSTLFHNVNVKSLDQPQFK